MSNERTNKIKDTIKGYNNSPIKSSWLEVIKKYGFQIICWLFTIINAVSASLLNLNPSFIKLEPWALGMIIGTIFLMQVFLYAPSAQAKIDLLAENIAKACPEDIPNKNANAQKALLGLAILAYIAILLLKSNFIIPMLIVCPLYFIFKFIIDQKAPSYQAEIRNELQEIELEESFANDEFELCSGHGRYFKIEKSNAKTCFINENKASGKDILHFIDNAEDKNSEYYAICCSIYQASMETKRKAKKFRTIGEWIGLLNATIANGLLVTAGFASNINGFLSQFGFNNMFAPGITDLPTEQNIAIMLLFFVGIYASYRVTKTSISGVFYSVAKKYYENKNEKIKYCKSLAGKFRKRHAAAFILALAAAGALTYLQCSALISAVNSWGLPAGVDWVLVGLVGLLTAIAVPALIGYGAWKSWPDSFKKIKTIFKSGKMWQKIVTCLIMLLTLAGAVFTSAALLSFEFNLMSALLLTLTIILFLAWLPLSFSSNRLINSIINNINEQGKTVGDAQATPTQNLQERYKIILDRQPKPEEDIDLDNKHDWPRK